MGAQRSVPSPWHPSRRRQDQAQQDKSLGTWQCSVAVIGLACTSPAFPVQAERNGSTPGGPEGPQELSQLSRPGHWVHWEDTGHSCLLLVLALGAGTQAHCLLPPPPPLAPGTADLGFKEQAAAPAHPQGEEAGERQSPHTAAGERQQPWGTGLPTEGEPWGWGARVGSSVGAGYQWVQTWSSEGSGGIACTTSLFLLPHS